MKKKKRTLQKFCKENYCDILTLVFTMCQSVAFPVNTQKTHHYLTLSFNTVTQPTTCNNKQLRNRIQIKP